MIYRIHYVNGLLPDGVVHEDIEADTIDYDVPDLYQLRKKLPGGLATYVVRSIPYSSVVSVEPLGAAPAPGLVAIVTPGAAQEFLAAMDDEVTAGFLTAMDEVETDLAPIGAPAAPGGTWMPGNPGVAGKLGDTPVIGMLPPITPAEEREGRTVLPARFLDKPGAGEARPTKPPENAPPRTFGQ